MNLSVHGWMGEPVLREWMDLQVNAEGVACVSGLVSGWVN